MSEGSAIETGEIRAFIAQELKRLGVCVGVTPQKRIAAARSIEATLLREGYLDECAASIERGCFEYAFRVKVSYEIWPLKEGTDELLDGDESYLRVRKLLGPDFNEAAHLPADKVRDAIKNLIRTKFSKRNERDAGFLTNLRAEIAAGSDKHCHFDYFDIMRVRFGEVGDDGFEFSVYADRCLDQDQLFFAEGCLDMSVRSAGICEIYIENMDLDNGGNTARVQIIAIFHDESVKFIGEMRCENVVRQR